MMPKICENVISSLSGSRMLTYPHIAGEPRVTKCEKQLVCCPGNAWPIQYIHHSGHCEQKWRRVLVALPIFSSVVALPIFSSGGYYFTQRFSIFFHPLIVVMPEGSKGSISEHERAPADLVRQETKSGLTSCMLEMLRIPSFSSSVSHFDLLENILDMK